MSGALATLATARFEQEGEVLHWTVHVTLARGDTIGTAGIAYRGRIATARATKQVTDRELAAAIDDVIHDAVTSYQRGRPA